MRRVGFACAVLFGACALITPAAAPAAAHGPRYSLKVVEGETTLPEYDQIAYTNGSVEPHAQVAVSIIRGGTTVYRDVDNNGSAWLSQVPQVGDVVTLESPVGVTIGSAVYDGLPSIDDVRDRYESIARDVLRSVVRNVLRNVLRNHGQFF